MERKAKVRGQSPPWMTWRKRLEVSVIGNIVFPKLKNSFKVQTLDKSLFIQFIKDVSGLGFPFLHFLWVSTHWSRTQRVCPRTFECGAPRVEGPCGAGTCWRRDRQKSLQKSTGFTAPGMTEEQMASLRVKVAIPKLNVFRSKDTGKEPLEITQQSYRPS